MNNGSNVIEVKGIDFSFQGNSVLRNITFSVRKNEFLLISGPNGGGKTTLLRLLLGILKPDRGDIRIFGNRPRAASRRIGYVPQNSTPNRDFPISVHDVVRMGRIGAPEGGGAEDDGIIRESLELVDMWEYRNRWIGELSGGERQRVYIARALAARPEMLFLDEPTASIDMEGQLKIYDILKTLNERTTMLVVTHDISALLGFAKSVAYVNGELHLHEAPCIDLDKLGELAGTNLRGICPPELLIRIVGTTPPNAGDADV